MDYCIAVDFLHTAMNLPDFLIIGTQKGGTTSLHRYLAQHPLISAAKVKEVHYFDGGLDPAEDTYKNGATWYASHFNEASKGLRFESTPLYLYNPLAPGRIKSLLPAAKMIVLLRDPVERAISHYFHNLKIPDREVLSLLRAMETEEDRLAASMEAGDYKSVEFIHFSYKSRGRYAEQLSRYFALFERQNILVVSSESLFSNPVAILNQVVAFLGLEPPLAPIDFSHANVGTNKTPVGSRTIDLLKTDFRRSNEQVFDLIGKRFPWT